MDELYVIVATKSTMYKAETVQFYTESVQIKLASNPLENSRLVDVVPGDILAISAYTDEKWNTIKSLAGWVLVE